ATHQVALAQDEVRVDGEVVDLAMEYTPGDRLIHAEVAGKPLSVKVEPFGAGFRLTTRGAIHTVQVLEARLGALTQHMLEKVAPDLSKYL
ncbi:hypothetical protein ABTN14_19170, partial [Acinetobacter baumannii]